MDCSPGSWLLELTQEYRSLLFSLQACLIQIPLPCLHPQLPKRLAEPGLQASLFLWAWGLEPLYPYVCNASLSSWSLQQSWSTMSHLCGQPTCSPFAWPGTPGFSWPWALPAYHTSATSLYPFHPLPMPQPPWPSNTASEGSALSPPLPWHFHKKVVSKENSSHTSPFTHSAPCKSFSRKIGKNDGPAQQHSSLGWLGGFLLLLHMRSPPRAGFCLRRHHAQICPGRVPSSSFYFLPGLVLQLSYYHLKGDILASVITLKFFSNYSKLRWEREALSVGVPLRYPRKPECGSRKNQGLSL